MVDALKLDRVWSRVSLAKLREFDYPEDPSSQVVVRAVALLVRVLSNSHAILFLSFVLRLYALGSDPHAGNQASGFKT